MPETTIELASQGVGPRGRFHAGGNSVEMVYDGEWTTADELVKQILGYTTSSGGAYHRTPPWSHPYRGSMIATSVDFEDLAVRGNGDVVFDVGPNKHGVYLKERMRVRFESTHARFLGDAAFGVGENQWQYESQRWCHKKVDPGRDYVTMPRHSFIDKAALPVEKPITFGVARLVAWQDILLTWFAIPWDQIPYAAIDECLGKVNSVPFFCIDRPPPGEYPAEEMLFQSIKYQETYLCDDTPAFDIQFRLRRRNPGWNKYLNDNGDYIELVRKADHDVGVYETADFNEMFLAP